MSKQERPDLIVRQNELLRTIPAEQIPHGADMPNAIVERFLPDGGFLLDLGCGNGEKRREHLHYGFLGVDINSEAVREAKKHDVIAYEGDVRHFFGSDMGLSAITWLENVDGVLCQGLLANLTSHADIQSVLETMDIALVPGGYGFIVEPIRWDKLFLTEGARHEVFKGHTVEEWQDMWIKRYARNAAEDLPMGVFAVAKPGPKKYELEWSEDPAVLQQLIRGPEFERYAQHVDYETLDKQLQGLEYTQQYVFERMLTSRMGEPLFGYIMVYRKEHNRDGQYVYKYHPWYKDFTRKERADFMNSWRQRYEHAHPYTAMYRYFVRFQHNVPSGQRFTQESWKSLLGQNK